MLRRARGAHTARNVAPTSSRLRLPSRFVPVPLSYHWIRLSSMIQNNSTLEERLGALLEPEVLTEDNQWVPSNVSLLPRSQIIQVFLSKV